MLWIGIALVVGALILNVVSVRLRRRGNASTAAPAANVSEIDDAIRAEIDRLVGQDNKIAAIRELRSAVPGLGLAEAKAHIDTWASSGTLEPAPADPGTVPTGLDADSLVEIDSHIASEELIAAIKLVRERTGWGLAESKRWVDARAGR